MKLTFNFISMALLLLINTIVVLGVAGAEVASTSTTGQLAQSNQQQQQLRALAAPYKVGTVVYYEFDDGWYSGEITAYDASKGEYTTEWEDGDIETFSQDDPDMDLMVDQASMLDDTDYYDPYDYYTIVYYNFPDDDDEWYQGHITNFSHDDNTYEITWEDGDVEEYDDLELVEQMVNDAEAALKGYSPWGYGTKLYYEFDDGWFHGEVTNFDLENGEYETKWEDGDVEYFDDFLEVNLMVDQAEDAPNGSVETKSRSSVATFGIVLAVLAMVAVATRYGYKKYSSRNENSETAPLEFKNGGKEIS